MLNHKGTQTLYTPRLTLRRLEMTDAAPLFKNYGTDEQVSRFLLWKPYKRVEDVEAFISGVIEDYSRPDTYHWAIVFDGEICGSISSYAISEKNLSCEIGYCLSRNLWGKGLTTEAAKAILRYMFEEIGMERVCATHDVDNPASGRVMEKCGMTHEGTLRKHYLRHDGVRSDAKIYGILKDDFLGKGDLK